MLHRQTRREGLRLYLLDAYSQVMLCQLDVAGGGVIAHATALVLIRALLVTPEVDVEH